PEMHSVCAWLLKRWGRESEMLKLQKQLTFSAPFEERRWFTAIPNISMIACRHDLAAGSAVHSVESLPPVHSSPVHSSAVHDSPQTLATANPLPHGEFAI